MLVAQLLAHPCGPAFSLSSGFGPKGLFGVFDIQAGDIWKCNLLYVHGPILSCGRGHVSVPKSDSASREYR